jgi:hypothetical protein
MIVPGLWSRPGGAMQAPCGFLRLPGQLPLRITARRRAPAAGWQALAELLPLVAIVASCACDHAQIEPSPLIPFHPKTVLSITIR